MAKPQTIYVPDEWFDQLEEIVRQLVELVEEIKRDNAALAGTKK